MFILYSKCIACTMAVGFTPQIYILIWFCVFIFYPRIICANGSFRTTQIGPKPKWNETHLDTLKKDLLMNYDKYARPEHHDNVTFVKIGITVLHLEVDEARSMIMVHSWLRLLWTDSKLTWDDHDYGGLTVIRIGDHEVWHPDIYLYNSASGGGQIARPGTRNVLVYPNGEVLWIPPVTLNALCDYDLQYWPFDTQHCHLKLGSWLHSDRELNISLYNNSSSADVESTTSGCAWEMQLSAEIVTKKYKCCVDTYSNVLVNLTLTRKSAPYYAIVVTPAVVTTVLVLLQFWLPPNAGEKIILNGFVIVLLNMFLLYFNHQVAKTTSVTPLIVSFYSNSLHLTGFSTIGAVATFSLSRLRKRRPLPEIIKKCLNTIGKWLFLEQHFNEKHEDSHNSHNENIEEMKDHQLSELENKAKNQEYLMDAIKYEWNVFITAIDRIFFIVCCFVYFVLVALLL